MSRNGDEGDATLRFDDKSKTNISEESSKMRGSIDAKLEDLMKRLEKLTAKSNKLRRKVEAKRRPYKGERKEKPRSKRLCYN
jgi:ribosome-associated translation inhibitor RaiA